MSSSNIIPSDIPSPATYKWERYEVDFGDAKVELWCPQAEGFEEHEKDTLGRKGGIDKEELEEFTAFKNWKANMRENLARQQEDPTHQHHKRPYRLKSVHVNAVTRFPHGKVGFVKMDAWIQRDPKKKDQETHEKKLEEAEKPASTTPAIDYQDTLFETVFLRGGSVAVLMIIHAKGKPNERWVVLTEQARVPACSLRFLEIPAGMMDKSNSFGGAAAKEIKEETGLTIPQSELINMTALALKDSDKLVEDRRNNDYQETLEAAMYPSPGGCDEYISLFVWEKEMDRVRIQALRGRMTGERHGGELITLRLLKYSDLWKVGARDAKTLGALALYEGLKESGILAKEQERLVKGQDAEATGHAGGSISAVIGSIQRHLCK